MLNGGAHLSTSRMVSYAFGGCLIFKESQKKEKVRLPKITELSFWQIGGYNTVSAQDHNKTLVMLHSAIGAFYSCALVASPWIIEKNFRRAEQIPAAIAIFGLVFLIALLFWSSAILMYRRKRFGRTLALIAAPFTLFGFWPVGIYAWWFMHSERGKSLYGVSQDAT